MQIFVPEITYVRSRYKMSGPPQICGLGLDCPLFQVQRTSMMSSVNSTGELKYLVLPVELTYIDVSTL